MDDFGIENCYDFGVYICLEMMEVMISFNKLIVQVDGIELCFYYIYLVFYIGIVMVIFVSSCGCGIFVIWMIYVNSFCFCGDFGRNFNILIVNVELKVVVYFNFFVDQLNVNIVGFVVEGVYMLELVDMLGRVVY